MEKKVRTFKFKDGNTVEGVEIARALCVIIAKVDGHFCFLNRFELTDDSDSELSEDSSVDVSDTESNED